MAKSSVTLTSGELVTVELRVGEVRDRLTKLEERLSYVALVPSLRELTMELRSELASARQDTAWAGTLLGVWSEEAERSSPSTPEQRLIAIQEAFEQADINLYASADAVVQSMLNDMEMVAQAT